MRRVRFSRPRHPEAALADLRSEALIAAISRHLMR